MAAFEVILFRLPVYYKNIDIQIYRIIMLPVLYGCDTWLLKFREEYWARFFENRAIRKIFGPIRDEVTGERRRLHREELLKLHFLPSSFG